MRHRNRPAGCSVLIAGPTPGDAGAVPPMEPRKFAHCFVATAATKHFSHATKPFFALMQTSGNNRWLSI